MTSMTQEGFPAKHHCAFRQQKGEKGDPARLCRWPPTSGRPKRCLHAREFNQNMPRGSPTAGSWYWSGSNQRDEI